MKVTSIARVGKNDKFAVFVGDKLKLVLSGQSILENKITIGLDMSEATISELKDRAEIDQVYLKTLNYLSHRLRTEGEIVIYLKRRAVSDDIVKELIDRLKKLDLINDERYAAAYIHDKLLISPTSRRAIAYELKKKRIAEDIIQTSLSHDNYSDDESLKQLVQLKRRQSQYQDDLKLMQYLVRKGFSYGDVKRAISESDSPS